MPAIASIGPTEAKVTPIITGSRMPNFQMPTDWIKVTGLFVPEAKIGEQTIYDTVLAEEVTLTKPPMLRDLF